MTRTDGWEILKRDVVEYINSVGAKLPYLDPTSREFYESRILFIASDKLLKLVEDYDENNKKAKELLLKLATTNSEVMMDVDGE